ncbi:MAG: DNA repair protein RadC [Oscillospiraceae bacterium]|nr:DNA repair protein RadC [Oscillospiraceae bacterium]
MGIHDGHREKKRQQFLQHGLDSFADHEVLELLLFYAIPRKDTNPIAHALMDRFGSLDAVLSAPVEELCRVEGVGPAAAALLKLTPQVYRRSRIAAAERERVLNSSQRAGDYLLELFTGETAEVLYELCLDRKGKLLACRRVGEGGVSSINVDLRKIVENALLTGASGVILSHNHPSGIALPSADDCAATVRVKEALKTVGLVLVDHIVVADGDYVSMADSGQLR